MSAVDLTTEKIKEEEGYETEPGVELELEDESEGIEALAESIESTAEGFEVADFKCPKCGLPHGHATDKHRAQDSFNISMEQAANMEMSPNCHCGYNYIAHNADELGVIDAPSPEEALDTAPIPQHIQQSIRNVN